MNVEIQYGVTFGKCDSSDWCEWEVELTDEEAAIYERAVKLHMPLNDIPELQNALSRAYDEIEENEIENFLAFDDEYVRECTGRYPVDEDELTELVRNRDAHAISFLGLEGLSDEELDEWEASDLDEIPDVCDFDESFEAESPFDGGWILHVEFVDNSEDGEFEDGEIEAALRMLFAEADGDYTELREYMERMDTEFWLDEDICALAYEIAKELKLTSYLEEYADEAGEEEGE